MPHSHMSDLLSYRRSDPYRNIQTSHLPPINMTLKGLTISLALTATLIYAAIDCGLF